MQQHPATSVAQVTLPASLLQQQEPRHQQQPQAQTATETEHDQQQQQETLFYSQADFPCSSHRAAAAACMAAGRGAVSAYERSKEASAAAARANSLALRQEVRQLQQQRQQAIAAGASRAKQLSNRVSGVLRGPYSSDWAALHVKVYSVPPCCGSTLHHQVQPVRLSDAAPCRCQKTGNSDARRTRCGTPYMQ